MLRFGCVADDFTGASDAASFLQKGGLSVQLYNGVPGTDIRPGEDVEAVVIALKSRTEETKTAVRETLAAVRWLSQAGAEQFYLKYCSTFDSTPSGNIGPCADAVMEALDVPYTLLCPALPVNGRTVSGGRLYVNGVPLDESPMKNHPLTPMWDSSIAKLMEPQSRYRCRACSPKRLLAESEEKRREALGALLCADGEAADGAAHFYLVPDYEDDADGAWIAEQFGDLRFLTGGSGLLQHLAARLAKKYAGHDAERTAPVQPVEGAAILLAGSCSKATLGQIARFIEDGGKSFRIDPIAMLEGRASAEDALSFVRAHADEAVLIYSSDTADNVKKAQAFGRGRIAAMLEGTMADIAEAAVKEGVCRVIVAGGETSGAVTERLGFSAYQIGESVAPGVPVMEPLGQPGIRLVLKSGNFGQPDFFLRALEMTGKDPELEQKLADAVWIAHSLFARSRTTGSSANMSFLHRGKVYMTKSGSCFGTLQKDDFSVLDMDGARISGDAPSKEWPLHLAAYRAKPEAGAVLHTHGVYAVLWSFVPAQDETDVIPAHTPYLKMKLGTVGMVPYHKPGSRELFDAFSARAEKSDGYLLKQHGAVVPAKTLMDAFYAIEELEESAHVAWELYRAGLGA